MKLNQTTLLHRDHKHLKTNLGDVYLFENFVVTEFKEGVDLSFDNFYDIGIEIGKYYWKKPFGFIANRSSAYSIDLKDAEILNMAFPNLKAYAIIVYNDYTEKVFEVENLFFNFNRKLFKSLEEGITWVETSLSNNE